MTLLWRHFVASCVLFWHDKSSMQRKKLLYPNVQCHKDTAEGTKFILLALAVCLWHKRATGNGISDLESELSSQEMLSSQTKHLSGRSCPVGAQPATLNLDNKFII